MFSGKSQELIRRISRFNSINIKTLVINHKLDTRTDNSIKTHSNLIMNAIKTEKLLDLINTEKFLESQVIGIDEAQFFTDLYEFVLLCEKNNKSVIIAGLDGDSERKPFGQICECIPLCDDIIKLKAYDMINKDGTEAIFTKKIIKEEKQISIGSSEKYLAVNRTNFNS